MMLNGRKFFAIFASIGIIAVILAVFIFIQENNDVLEKAAKNNKDEEELLVEPPVVSFARNEMEEEKIKNEERFNTVQTGNAIEESNSVEHFQKLSEDEKANYLANLDQLNKKIFLFVLTSKECSAFLKNLALQKISYFAGDGEDVSDLIEMGLNDPNVNVRECAMSIIEAIENHDIQSDILFIALKTKYKDNRIKAIKYALELNLPKKVTAKLLTFALNDNELEVRQWALATASLLWDKDFENEKEAIECLKQ